jgi:hypothetical protein
MVLTQKDHESLHRESMKAAYHVRGDSQIHLRWTDFQVLSDRVESGKINVG